MIARKRLRPSSSKVRQEQRAGIVVRELQHTKNLVVLVVVVVVVVVAAALSVVAVIIIG